MSATYRRLNYFDVEVAARSKKATPPSMTEILAILEKRVKAGKNILLIEKETKSVMLGQIDVDSKRGIASLLFRLCDKTMADAVYSAPSRQGFRRLEKEEDEFGEVGAHAILSLVPEKNLAHHHFCLIEQTKGLSAPLMQRVINRILHEQYDDDSATFTFKDPSGGKKVTPFLPHVEFLGRLSDSFIADLNGGRLTSVTLIHAEQHTPVGQRAFLIKKRRELLLSIDRKFKVKDVWNALISEIQPEAKHFETTRISFSSEGKSSGTIYVDTATGLTQDVRYIKSTMIENISPPLAQSASAIVPHLADPMISIVMGARNI